MDTKITLFLQEQKILSLCTTNNCEPNCAICFYAFIPDSNTIVIKSSSTTQHVVNAIQNNKVAGTIVPYVNKINNVKGIQFKGVFCIPLDVELENAKKSYYKKYPFALAISGDLYTIELAEIKMTDNTLGFGKKLEWKKEKQLNTI